MLVFGPRLDPFLGPIDARDAHNDEAQREKYVCAAEAIGMFQVDVHCVEMCFKIRGRAQQERQDDY